MVGPRLRRVREQRGLTLTEASVETGISKSTLSRLETGQRKPSLELLLPLAQTYRVPLDELLEATFEIFRRSHPWVSESALSPKSVVREMYERAMTFTEFVSAYQLARSEGTVLRYLSDAYRTLRQLVPASYRNETFDELLEWLGETIRQTDSSLLDEWEALSDPDHASSAVAHHEPPPPPRPLSKQERPFRVMLRNAMWARVDAVSRDDLDGLVRLERAAADRTDPPRQVVVGRSVWDEALEDYYAEHDRVLTDGDARGPDLLVVGDERTGEPVGADRDLLVPVGGEQAHVGLEEVAGGAHAEGRREVDDVGDLRKIRKLGPDLEGAAE